MKIDPTCYDKEIFNLLSLLLINSSQFIPGISYAKSNDKALKVLRTLQKCLFEGKPLLPTLKNAGFNKASITSLFKYDDDDALDRDVKQSVAKVAAASFPSVRSEDYGDSVWLNFYLFTLLEQLHPKIKFTSDIKGELIKDLLKHYNKAKQT